MTKQEVISQVQSSLGSLFTREDVIKCLNMVVEEPKVKPKMLISMLNYPSKQWLDKIKDTILDSIRNVDFNDSDMFELDSFEYSIRYGNQIELDSFDVNACSLKTYVENEIENAFGGIEDDIIDIQNEEDRLNENEALKEAMED